MAKKKNLVSWSELDAQSPAYERHVAAYERMMEAETLLYELWEARGEPMNWVGELVGGLSEELPESLWVFGIGEKVAALGGHLELVGVFPDRSITLIREPGLGDDAEAQDIERP